MGQFRAFFLLAVLALANDLFPSFSSADTPHLSSRALLPDAMESKSKRALLLVADGSEDMETVISSDILTRGDFEVLIASVKAERDDGVVTLANGTMLMPHKKLSEVMNEAFDVIVLPGGMTGAGHFKESTDVKKKLDVQDSKKKWIAAICASPKVVLQGLDILRNRPATGYPSLEPENLASGNVVISENIITSRGPGTATEFSLAIVEAVWENGAERRVNLERQLLVERK